MILLGLQIIFGMLAFALGVGLSKNAIDAVGNSTPPDAGIVRLLLCAFGIVCGGLAALLGLFSLVVR